jgi:Zn-dependent oligopeptidase
VTFFHEMGHAFHGLLSKTRFHRFHGTNVAWDFVEAPSKMLENWCWEPRVLRLLSAHHETGEPLPEEMIQKLVKSYVVVAIWKSGEAHRTDDRRYHNVGLAHLFQLVHAKFDMKVHTDNSA